MAAHAQLPDGMVRIGVITKPHGIKGEVKAQPDFGSPDDFRNYRQVVLVDKESEDIREFLVIRSRPQDRAVILQFEGLTDRDAAEELCGSELWIKRSLLPELPEGEFYWHDLVGLNAETEGGRKLGRVETLFATPGHDILVIRGSGREYLVPLNKEFINTSNSRNGILIIKEVPGLFQIND